MSDEVTTHQIKGFCEAVMMRGDWQEFHINIGKQYPVKLSTEARTTSRPLADAAGQQRRSGRYTERTATRTPTGRASSSRTATSRTSSSAAAARTRRLRGKEHVECPGRWGVGGANAPPDDRAESIERQVIVKSVLPMLG